MLNFLGVNKIIIFFLSIGTLDDLSKKVTEVKEENLKLKSENQVLGSYIENLMNASNVFQSALQKQTKKQ